MKQKETENPYFWDGGNQECLAINDLNSLPVMRISNNAYQLVQHWQMYKSFQINMLYLRMQLTVICIIDLPIGCPISQCIFWCVECQTIVTNILKTFLDPTATSLNISFCGRLIISSGHLSPIISIFHRFSNYWWFYCLIADQINSFKKVLLWFWHSIRSHSVPQHYLTGNASQLHLYHQRPIDTE